MALVSDIAMWVGFWASTKARVSDCKIASHYWKLMKQDTICTFKLVKQHAKLNQNTKNQKFVDVLSAYQP